MKIIMTLFVRNEQDIIKHNIDFHRSQGVDFFIATDNCSEDGTSEILRDYERQGILHYIWGDPDFNQGTRVTHMARLAYNEYGADWVINNDADEFWWPLAGDLRSVLSDIPQNCNIVRVKRHNFVPVSQADEAPFYTRMIYREQPSLNLRGNPLPDKVCHRGNPDITVFLGSHRVEELGPGDTRWGKIEILHFPFRTYDQFERKVIALGQPFARSKRGDRRNIGIVRIALYRLYETGRLPDYYRLLLYSPSRIAKELEAGFIVKDTRLAEHFSNLIAVSDNDIPKRLEQSAQSPTPASNECMSSEFESTELATLSKKVESRLWAIAQWKYGGRQQPIDKVQQLRASRARLILLSFIRLGQRGLKRLKGNPFIPHALVRLGRRGLRRLAHHQRNK